MQKYRFYREHKYVSHELNDLERKIAKCDFRLQTEVEKLHQQFANLKAMLESHAEHENVGIHELLRKKGSRLHEQCESEHKKQTQELSNILSKFESMGPLEDEKQRIEHGHELYLLYRTFIADMLRHLNDEETQIMPELQRLCSEEEMRSVDAKHYAVMSEEEVHHMLDVLSPHMNPSDYEFFMDDIRRSRGDDS